MTSNPLALAYTAEGSLFVATRERINEHDASDPSKIRSTYELDQADNLVTSLQVSSNLVAFTTRSKNMFLYQRKEHKINYLLAKEAINDGNMFVLSSQLSYLYTFNLTQAQAVSVGQAYLTLNDLSSNDSLKITATSLVQVC